MAAQLALDQAWSPPVRHQKLTPSRPRLCAGCQAREARYGFRPDQSDPLVERPRALCFECFRSEIGKRYSGTETIQVRLPLEQTLESLGVRRRRAQIAARRALVLSGL